MTQKKVCRINQSAKSRTVHYKSGRYSRSLKEFDSQEEDSAAPKSESAESAESTEAKKDFVVLE